MKRFFIVLALMLAMTAFFVWRTAKNTSLPLVSPRSDVERRTEPQSAPKTEPQARSHSSNDGEKPLQPKPAAGTVAKQVRGVDFNSYSNAEKQRIVAEYKATLQREFDPLKLGIELTGTVSLTYRKYEGKFKIQFQKSAEIQ